MMLKGPPVFVLLGLPMAWLVVAVSGEIRNPGSMLGADPPEAVLLHLGEWGLRALLLTLSHLPRFGGASVTRRFFG